MIINFKMKLYYNELINLLIFIQN